MLLPTLCSQRLVESFTWTIDANWRAFLIEFEFTKNSRAEFEFFSLYLTW